MTNLNETNDSNVEEVKGCDVPGEEKELTRQVEQVEASGYTEEAEEGAADLEAMSPQSLDNSQPSSSLVTPSSCDSGKCSGSGSGGPGALFPTLGSYLPPEVANLQKIYALGNLALDFGTEVKQDIILQHMEPGSNPHDIKHMIAHFEKNPMDAGAVTWTMTLNGTPIYAILPAGPFAPEGYQILLKMLKAQEEEGAERISLPGNVTGTAQLMSGMAVPVVCPDFRGIFSWATKDLVDALCGKEPDKDGKQKEEFLEKVSGVRNLLDKIYYDIRNLGVSSPERAINYAATNAFNIEKIFESTAKKNFHLSAISTEKSATSRPGSDCWDVKLIFFDPEKQFTRAKQVFRYTIDVSDVLPVKVGPIRSWNEH